MERKTAIVLVGAGMRSAHGAGFLYALGTKLGITLPDIMVASSGDSANMLYFATGQYESTLRIWTDILPQSRFIYPWRFWNIMNIDFLIDTVFKKLEPLDITKLRASPIQWFISVTDYDTGKPRYIGATDDIEPFEALRASKAIPFLFGRKVLLSGHRYFDGEMGPRLEDHVRHAVNNGAENILIVSHTSEHGPASKLLERLCILTFPSATRDAVIRDLSINASCISVPGVRIVCVAPQSLPASIATRDQKKMDETFNCGVSDAMQIEGELRELFNTPTLTSNEPVRA